MLRGASWYDYDPLSESSFHFVAFTRQIVVVRTPAFVVFLLGSLRGEAAPFCGLCQ